MLGLGETQILGGIEWDGNVRRRSVGRVGSGVSNADIDDVWRESVHRITDWDIGEAKLRSQGKIKNGGIFWDGRKLGIQADGCPDVGFGWARVRRDGHAGVRFRLIRGGVW